ncbi:MAG: hypothetical protein PF450_02585, partial [Bacteroidales bacterium]|nr:hypothetical protein [Bacteroidales bacterium]
MKSVRNLHLLKTSLFISILLLLPSCSEWYVRDKQYIDLSADEERWFVAEEYKDKLVLGDRLGNIETFSFENEWQGWNMHGSSSGLEREETYFENKNQSFISSRGTDYNIQMNPEEPPQGTMLSVEVKDLRFRYDLHHK